MPRPGPQGLRASGARGCARPAVEIDDVEGVTVLGVNPPWLPRSSRAIKRGMDLLIAIPLLLLAAPLLGLIAVAIKLDSRGPVFFAQERVGRGNRFRLFKLRTMAADAEQRREGVDRAQHRARLAEARSRSADHAGRPLAAPSSLDELPELWNVVRGEMSVVGPRPLIPAEDEHVRLHPWSPRPDSRYHRLLAGFGPNTDPLRGDGQARLPVRDELVPVGRCAADAPDVAGDRWRPRSSSGRARSAIRWLRLRASIRRGAWPRAEVSECS